MFHGIKFSTIAAVVFATSVSFALTSAALASEGCDEPSPVTGKYAGKNVYGSSYRNGTVCFEKAIRKYDRYYGRMVTVGYRTVCR